MDSAFRCSCCLLLLFALSVVPVPLGFLRLVDWVVLVSLAIISVVFLYGFGMLLFPCTGKNFCPSVVLVRASEVAITDLRLCLSRWFLGRKKVAVFGAV